MDSIGRAKEVIRIAAIDIGTNTALLLIADVDPQGTFIPVFSEQQTPRLGKDVDKSLRIDISAFPRITSIISSYQTQASALATDVVVACATSAVRDSSNRDALVSYVRSTTGISLEILSGDDEALWTFRGVISGISDITTSSLVVLDIGGGSTEITIQQPGQNNIRDRYSLQVGAVRMTERYFLHHPPLDSEIEHARSWIHDELTRIQDYDLRDSQLVGVAGTVTTLACLDQSLKEFSISAVSGYTMDVGRVRYWCDKLLKMTSDEILELTYAARGRSDILAAGACILAEFMETFHCGSLRVSERGLRYGLVLREWQRLQRSPGS